MDDESDSPEYDLMISSKDWRKVTDTHLQAGFREGAEEGRKKSFQKGFDVGYAEGFSVGHKLGIIRGILSVLQNDSGHSLTPTEDGGERYKPLGNPLINICKLCEEDNKDSALTVSEVSLKQGSISAAKIKELIDQHTDQFTKFGIVIGDIMNCK